MAIFATTLGAAMLDCSRLFERPHSARRSDVAMPALASARRGNARRWGRDEARTRWSHLMASAVLRRSHRGRETGRRSVRHSRRFSLCPARPRELTTGLCRTDYYRTPALRAEEALHLR